MTKNLERPFFHLTGSSLKTSSAGAATNRSGIASQYVQTHYFTNSNPFLMKNAILPFGTSCSLIRFLGALTISIIICLNISDACAQVKLWGTAPSGGTDNAGTIFNLALDGSNFTVAHNFELNNPSTPNGTRQTLLKASNGKFYGVCRQGGATNKGLIFEYDPATEEYTVLYESFGTDGYLPTGSLAEVNGKIYGTAPYDDDLPGGILFEYDLANGTYNVRYNFDASTGSLALGGLIASGSKLYGMTYYGGSNSDGVIYEYDPAGSGTYTVLHHFQAATGKAPFGTLLIEGGKFYGMTYSGGTHDYGVIFEFNPTGSVYTVLHHFNYPTGSNPVGGLMTYGGKFYGMTQGGNNGGGVFFEYDPAGSGYTVLHPVGGEGGLIEAGGKFYGMTGIGLFEYDPAGSGTYTILQNFDVAGATGYAPAGSPMLSDGKLYGLTGLGGSYGANGVLFEYDLSGGTYQVKINFSEVPYGGAPRYGLLEYDGKYYGMGGGGGDFGAGVLFEYDPAGTGAYNVLHHFGDAFANGSYPPNAGVVEAGGKLYGTLTSGGTFGNGVLFEYDLAGASYSVRHHFDHTQYTSEYGLTSDNNKIYGTTSGGLLFELDPAGSGTFTTLYDFNNSTAYGLTGNVTIVGGKFYGTTYGGGANDAGVLYEYDPAGGGTLTFLYEFDFVTGAYPADGVIFYNNKIYGTTDAGGANDYGVLYEFDPAGDTYTVLHDFDVITGGYPDGRPVVHEGTLYGLCPFSGFNGDLGVVYAYDLDADNYSAIKYLSSADGYLIGSCGLIVVSEDVGPPVISGRLIWEHDDATGVGNATVALTGDQTGSVVTPADGTYSFTVTPGSSVTVTPTKTINKLNGITVGDATAIQKHVAGVIPITDPYKIVAADVNKSNSVTTQDVVIIIQSLAGNPAALANFKTSWRFAPTAYPLTMPPWNFSEKIAFGNVTSDMPDQDFFGIKTGDVVAAHADPANFGAGDNELVLNVPDQELQTGETVTVEFKANYMNDLAAFQFALKFDPEKLALAEIVPQTGLPLTADNFGAYNLSEGEIRVVWSQAESTNLEEAAPVFSLKFKVLQSGGRLSDVLWLEEEVLPALTYTGDLQESRVELRFEQANSVSQPGSQPTLLSIHPNPFVAHTTAVFELPQACTALLRVLDASGRELWRLDKSYSAGWQREAILLEGATGVLVCELVTPWGVKRVQMVGMNH